MMSVHDKGSLLDDLERTRYRMQQLVKTLSEAQQKPVYHPGINPPWWEMGHAAFFFEIFVLRFLDGTPTIDPAMDEKWDSFHIAHKERWSPALFPDATATLAYVDAVHERVRRRIESQPLTDEALYLYRYAIAHQNMHIESMIWCRQTLGYPAPPSMNHEAVFAADQHCRGDTIVPAGDYCIGMPAESTDFAGTDFAFDNEKPALIIQLPDFAISRTLVSNGEFQRFVDDDGYMREEFWSQGGRRWLRDRPDLNFQENGHQDRLKRHHPVYWRKHQGSWQERLFDQWQTLDPSFLVRHVSFWEAEAFCRWAGRRLPTEFEWEAAALNNRPDQPRRFFPWGTNWHDGRADMDATAMAQLATTALEEGDSPFGCRQMIGTLWEWTSSEFMPYDGFTKDMYPFMSTLQFADHKTTRGGSCATSSALIRGTYRQAYFPDRTDVFTGFRTCALD